MNTPHQERSRSVLDSQITQEILHLPQPIIIDKLMKLLHLQCKQLGMFNVQNYLKAKEDKAKGGEGLMHSKYWEN